MKAGARLRRESIASQGARWHHAKMNRSLLAAAAAFALSLPLSAQEEPKGAPSPGEIVIAAPGADWAAIPAEDLLVMTLAPDADGKPRIVVIQLMPAPFSQGWVHNIRLFARSGWYDGISVNRVQDNYVTQWGDPNYDNPEATGEPKPLPEGLKVMGEDEYTAKLTPISDDEVIATTGSRPRLANKDPYAGSTHALGWPIAGKDQELWPVHCYGMVGVGRNYSPDTGSGAELYTVIGHAPRQLDRNIALVGRVIAGMEHLSSLPRGRGALGFYAADEADKRTPILSVQVASDLMASEQPKFEYLRTESNSFAAYAEAIANRRDPFFITPAGGADICNIRVPVRAVAD
jgi:cyclophilin family peptidyl-prolyl cis-trans isomerase